MKKVLFVSNIQVPYRVEFFNKLAEKCDLTVLYERSQSKNRNEEWTRSIKDNYKKVFLDGIKIGNESSFSLKIFKYILGDYDLIILGCYNTPVQMIANIVMRLITKPFALIFDGEVFAENKTLKTYLKKFFIRGAKTYLVAGKHAAISLRNIVGHKKQIIPFYFSSLSKNEVEQHGSQVICNRESYILVVGQYYAYKGLDIAVHVAEKLPNLKFKFVGMGKRTDLFIKENNIDNIANIEVIPFLSKSDLEQEYKRCRLLLLPSRQECWGLVVNEAASYGTPIVSTWGSGAAVEFLHEMYSEFLAIPGDVDSLKETLVNAIDKLKYDLEITNYLLKKSEQYNIEKSVDCYLKTIY